MHEMSRPSLCGSSLLPEHGTNRGDIQLEHRRDGVRVGGYVADAGPIAVDAE